MKDLKVLFLNCAARAFEGTLSWEKRLKKIIEIIKKLAPDAFIIGLCEFLPGKIEKETGESKYINIINNNLQNYNIILPLEYDKDKNFKSGINLILVNKKYYKRHDLRELDGLEEGKYLYNYIGLDSTVGYWRILNAHFPVADPQKAEWFQKRRETLGEAFEKVITEELDKYKDEPDIPFVFTADTNRNYDSEFIKRIISSEKPIVIDSTREEDKGKLTYKSSKGGSNHIDFILYSKGMDICEVYKANPTEIIYETIDEKLTDHALLMGSITVDIEALKEIN